MLKFITAFNARDSQKCESTLLEIKKKVISLENHFSHYLVKQGTRDPPIMLIILPIMLRCTAKKFTYYA